MQKIEFLEQSSYLCQKEVLEGIDKPVVATILLYEVWEEVRDTGITSKTDINYILKQVNVKRNFMSYGHHQGFNSSKIFHN